MSVWGKKIWACSWGEIVLLLRSMFFSMLHILLLLSPYFSRIHMNTVVSKMWCFFLWRYSSSPTSLTFVIFCFLVSLRECQAQPSVKYPFSRNWTTLMWFSFWTWYMPTKTFSWFLSTWTWTWKNTWMISLATMMTGQGYQKTCQR